MGSYKRFWWVLIGILLVTFTLLGWMGREIYHQAPPIPSSVVTTNGTTLMTQQDILDGQSAWQSAGGMTVGSLWGHGAYQAPDWTADWLHRELTTWLDIASKDIYRQPFAKLTSSQQAGLKQQLKEEYRHNTFDPDTGVVTVSERRARAMTITAHYYTQLFGDAPELKVSRQHFAMKENTLPDPTARARMADFFFWSAWSAATERPHSTATYTNNWPHEPLIDNVPTVENVVWSIISIILLIAGVGLLIWVWAFIHKEEPTPQAPTQDPIGQLALTPSQRALGKYLLVVVALFGFQMMIGGFTAHYTIEGQGFYGVDVSQWIPYSLARTWHVQAALFWIATAFLAAGLFMVPIINGGRDPKWQKLGVDVLFWAFVLVVVGSFTGNFLALSHILPDTLRFWLGHQGYEYLELGRLWQIALFGGIVFWLGLMLRGMLPALKLKGDNHLLALLVASVICIGLFYGAGLFYGEKTHISIMEYWRWWVVHLWVEGFFEVFATTALAVIFATMGLVSKRSATTASLAAASLFMLGGVPGTMHHLYFSGTPTPIMAIGAAFSALEVVPLIVLGYEAWGNWRLKDRAAWMIRLRWPLLFFVAVAFWNMIGAGVFGFMINPPVALFYVQGLNTTAVHAHAALFGVYGFLALGFTIFVLRYLRPDMVFNDRLMRVSFWCLNGGLVLMIAISLLPVGLLQFAAAVGEGTWWARSEEFMQQDLLQTLRWWRMLGDTVFIVGGLGVALQVVLNLLGWGRRAIKDVEAGRSSRI